LTDIARTTVILDVIADSRRSLTLSDLSARTGYPRSSVHRIMQALERELFVVRQIDRPGYTLGPGLLKFGLNAHLRLLGANRSQLVTLSRAVSERTELAVLSGRRAVVIDQVGTDQPVNAAGTGKHFSLHATGFGKALLAHLPAEQIHDHLATPLPRFTSNTLTTADAVLDDLTTIQLTHVAFDLEESSPGCCSVATATYTPVGGLQAVAVVIPTHRMRRKAGLAVEALHRINPRVDILAAKRYLQTRALSD
jgi:IclR family acetate operon transcriptional repressor